MELENRFVVGVPLANAWAGLLDIPLVVECLPGANLTETLDSTTHKGTIRVRLGPMAMEFAGKLHVESVDDLAHRAVVKASWNETRNRGSATSTSVLEAAAKEACVDVTVRTSVQLAGQIAQYGRGVGVIQAVSAELVKQFAANLQATLEQRQAQQPAPTSGVAAAQPQPPTPSLPKEISSFALLWATLKTWLRGLLAGR
ncbi:MAG: SRPBCC family protein [Burkholderiales bacterium]|nr:SRPBCC family protein [Burkholderiales bacterium]